ncbi:uncharacterized protein LOC125516011 isoform X5 [Triticum urartu]|uniref:uncharacterized protein LOC125516011 isoform X5 n=1 Tax=Triticum urartu TaxID=4572 RepID=UPI002043EE19|nr:uncharacterized protein LOC125516011 isoform X5 [Triticum urartu]
MILRRPAGPKGFVKARPLAAPTAIFILVIHGREPFIPEGNRMFQDPEQIKKCLMVQMLKVRDNEALDNILEEVRAALSH